MVFSPKNTLRTPSYAACKHLLHFAVDGYENIRHTYANKCVHNEEHHMNAFVGNLIPERQVWPRGLVGRPAAATDYSYGLGEVVTWNDEHWLVTRRETSLGGRHIYAIYREDDERPVRHVDGNVLLPANF
jgi:ABC-type sulfate transport system substrate-binding protein